MMRCNYCNGDGWYVVDGQCGPEQQQCENCYGEGTVPDEITTPKEAR